MMKRGSLCATLCATLVATGLYTAWLNCLNHQRAQDLDRAQRAVEELSAVRAGLLVEVDAHVPGVPDRPPLPGSDVGLDRTSPTAAHGLPVLSGHLR